MFEVKVYVEEKKLSEVLWALDGLIVQPPTILLIKGATAKKGKVVASHSGGSLIERIAGAIAASKVQKLQSAELKALIKSQHGNPNSSYYVVKGLQDMKVLGPYKPKEKVYPVKRI